MRPATLPQIRLAPPGTYRRYDAFVGARPELEITVSVPPPRLYEEYAKLRAEEHRRRHDDKIPQFYNRTLAFLNRDIGPLTEYAETAAIIWNNRNSLAGIFTGLALENWVDFTYGTLARARKRHLYDKGYWPFPVGYDTASRLWRTH